jgi:glycerophosphoryl diester phosphodiesterase
MSGPGSFVPEHSKAAYALGASYGVDYIEPDVVITKDGVLMVMHMNELGRTSDVADHPEFQDRHTTKLVDDGDGCGSNNYTGWFTEDFTWAEVSTLRLKATSYQEQGPLDGIYGFLKFDEMLAYVAELSVKEGRKLGVYPESKLSNYFRSIGLPLEDKFLETIAAHGYCGYVHSNQSGLCLASLATAAAPGPIYLQSFAPESLQVLSNMTDLTRIQLFGSASRCQTLAQLEDVATYASGISIPIGWGEAVFNKTTKMAQGQAGLDVHAWAADTDPAVYTWLDGLGVVNSFTNNVPFGRGALAEAKAKCGA